MAGSGGGKSPDLIQELLKHPQHFEFFQAVRIIERCAAIDERQPHASAVGSDVGPLTEPVRFRALPSLTFPPGQIAALNPDKTRLKGKAGRANSDLPDAFATTKDASTNTAGNTAITTDRSSGPLDPLEMIVSFMGLTGPNGVLPQHYTSLVIERVHQRYKDHTLREFLDLFNHRFISFFYRAWEKYRLPFAYERNQQEGGLDDDLFTRTLFSLVGLQIPGLRHRFSFDDQTIVFYGGLFAQQCRNAAGLQQILTSYFRVQTEVVQFCGQWLYLPEDTQSSLPSGRYPQGINLSLGESAVVGSRVWDVSSRIRIRLGPLTIDEFHELLPGPGKLTAVAELVRFYIGAQLDFDVQLVLRKQDIPPCRLVSGSADEPRLGWNTWMTSKPAVKDAEDAVFRF
ncbi:MAG: type VI secretion system baseplate subunit TssG [Planctomycetaceae bacterium]